jgi:ribonuclease T2
MTRIALRTAALLGIALASLAAPVEAQYGPGASGRAPYAYQGRSSNQAGRFDYYALVLSWSPTYCASRERNDDDPQCDRRDGRRFAFVLHGLWPQHERGWPQDCPTRERPFVPRATIDQMLDIMPSPKLVIHEYRKHGTCSGLAPNAYFDFARKAFTNVKIPQRYVRPNQAFFVTPGELKQEFVAANAQLKPDMMAISCGGPGGRLREVRICMSREGQFRSCGRNEDQDRLCRQGRMYVPPVRGTADGERDGGRQPPSPLPGPQIKGERRI